jgi:hypothetical protein
MALAQDLMGVGLPAQAAQRLGYVKGTLAATGSGNTDAAQMLKDATAIVVTGSASTGVKVPANAELMQPYLIVNGDANAKLVYPGTGNNFNGKTTTTGTIALNANGSTLVWRVSATQWAGLVGA